MPLSDLLTADRIVLLVEPRDRDAVMDAAARLLADGVAQRGQAGRLRRELADEAISAGHAQEWRQQEHKGEHTQQQEASDSAAQVEIHAEHERVARQNEIEGTPAAEAPEEKIEARHEEGGGGDIGEFSAAEMDCHVREGRAAR